VYLISKSIHKLERWRRLLLVFLAVLGPGMIVMVADNDAGGISTYAVTGSTYGFSLLWLFIILVPMAYYVQEMTVRLGAVTKRGHAEAIFEGFGPFWGWFSLADLAIVNWLTLITEYIGMIAAGQMFGVPPLVTFLGVTLVLFLVVLTGRYWTFEKMTLFFCCFNLVYIPAAFWAMDLPQAPSWGAVGAGLLIPNLAGNGLSGEMLMIILANIGTTIAPWMIFFQQSSTVSQAGIPKMFMAAVMPMNSVIMVSQSVSTRSSRENQPQNRPNDAKIASACPRLVTAPRRTVISWT